MSDAAFDQPEDDRLKAILSDIDTIIEKGQMELGEVDALDLQSDEVYNFLDDLRNDAKPEYALRDELLAGTAVLGKHLFGPKSPETSITTPDDETVGKIDYEIRDEPILIELKPLYKKRNGKLRQVNLDWRNHQDQIEKYLGEDYEYLIFTNLKDWYIFSKRHNGPITGESLSFGEYRDRLSETHGDLKRFLKGFEQQTRRGSLDDDFFDCLESWVSQLEDVEFNDDVTEQEKTEKIIQFINKFIFVRTLDDYSVIDLNWIESEWKNAEDSWESLGNEAVLNQFLTKVNKWFYEHYDTDLFPPETTLLDDIKDDEDNIDKFYRTVKRVLGVESWQQAASNDGITGFRYRDIDEDIYGKAYETFLAEKRNEEGIFYTPKYITEDIVETRVDPKFDPYVDAFEQNLAQEDFEAAKDALEEMSQQTVIDPACGSGSFLIKAIRRIWQKYDSIADQIEEVEDELKQERDNWFRADEDREHVSEMRSIIRTSNNRQRINQIIVRHIHGNDLDSNALAVAKVNIWKEAIKLAPSEFHYKRIPDDGYTLPDLQMNFGNGDALLGFEDDEAIQRLRDDHQETLEELFELRDEYLENPEDEEIVQRIGEVKNDLNDALYNDFNTYLEDEGYPTEVLDESDPMHWPVDFWYAYFDRDLTPRDDPGFDVLVGNPPYERIQQMREHKPHYVEYLNERESFVSTHGNYDIAVPFIEQGYHLLSDGGNFGYIVTKKWMNSEYGEKLREYLADECCVTELIDFGSEQVFDDPSTYTVILSLTKAPQEGFRYAQVTNLTKDPKQLDRIHESDEPRMDSDLYVTLEECSELDEGYWAFGTADEEKILDKIDEHPTLDSISDEIFVGLQTSADPVYIVEVREDRGDKLKVYSKHKDDTYTIKKDITKPILKGAEIERWAIRGYDHVLIFPYDISGDSAELLSKSKLKNDYRNTWDYFTDCREKLKEKRSDVDEDTWWEYPYPKNLTDFDQPKVIVQVNANWASFALDEAGEYYFVGGGTAGGYGVSFDEDETKLRKRVLGLLNSYLLDWRVKHESSEFQGEFFSFAKRYMEDLPIAELDNEDEFLDTVTTLVELAKSRYKIEGFWSERKSLATGEETLTSLLEKDQQARRYSGNTQSWFDSVEFYPDADKDILEQEFEAFDFRGDSSNNRLTIYGVEGEAETQIYQLRFKNQRLLNIVYLALKDLFDTRKKVEKLEHILDKTEVPVINPNSAENTPRLMEEIESDFDDWVDEAEIDTDVSTDVIDLENREHELFIDLNGTVFDTYGLTADEAMTVMNKTSVRHRDRDKILDLL